MIDYWATIHIQTNWICFAPNNGYTAKRWIHFCSYNRHKKINPVANFTLKAPAVIRSVCQTLWAPVNLYIVVCVSSTTKDDTPLLAQWTARAPSHSTHDAPRASAWIEPPCCRCESWELLRTGAEIRHHPHPPPVSIPLFWNRISLLNHFSSPRVYIWELWCVTSDFERFILRQWLPLLSSGFPLASALPVQTARAFC